MFSNIEYIVNKYISKYKNSLELLTHESSNENYNTITKIDNQSNIKDLELFDYDEVIILFTDIKNSTQILETCEKKSILNVYSNYINFSSKLLGEIITIFKGRIIESTGDGNYSIINLTKNDFNEIVYNRKSNISRKTLRILLDEISEETFYKDMKNKTYLDIFDINEKNYILEKLEYISSIDDKLRTLFFIIFAKFNREINKIDLLEKHNIKFATRIGCKIGSCQITNIMVNGHINQDKLIGTVAHKAAHQASGKKLNMQAEV